MTKTVDLIKQREQFLDDPQLALEAEITNIENLNAALAAVEILIDKYNDRALSTRDIRYKRFCDFQIKKNYKLGKQIMELRDFMINTRYIK